MSSDGSRAMPDVIIKNLPFLLAGLRLTAEISVLSIIGGSALGVAIGIVRHVRVPALAQLFDVYVEFVRGTPLLVVLFIWVRWMFPRFRYDQLMDLGWRRFVPLALANILITAIVLWMKS